MMAAYERARGHFRFYVLLNCRSTLSALFSEPEVMRRLPPFIPWYHAPGAPSVTAEIFCPLSPLSYTAFLVVPSIYRVMCAREVTRQLEAAT